MNKRMKVAAVAVATAALLIGGTLPAQAATKNYSSQSCSGGLRAAVYLGAKGDIRLTQYWNGGSGYDDWSNGSAAITRVRVVPIGVATMTRGTGTYGSGWTQAGQDCRIW